MNVITIECEGWRQHSSIIFLILLFTKPNIKVSGWLYQNKKNITHIFYPKNYLVIHPNYVYICEEPSINHFTSQDHGFLFGLTLIGIESKHWGQEEAVLCTLNMGKRIPHKSFLHFLLGQNELEQKS